MSDMLGLWIARFADRTHGTSRRITQWHLIESEIAERKVTKCGRQLGEIEGTVLAPLVAPPTKLEACYFCTSRVQ